MKNKKRILMLVCLLCGSYSIISFARSIDRTLYNTSKSVYANVNVDYDNNTNVFDLYDFLGYGARVGGQDVEYVTRYNPATIRISADKSGGVVSEIFYYGHPISDTETILLGNKYITTRVTIENCQDEFTIN